jgi:DNA-binding NarL/FixJ family response regulator
VCRAHYGTVLMLRGDWERAEAELSEAATALAATPREGADAFARLAELRRRQGRTDDAMAALARAEHHPLAILCLAALALERGDLDAAAETASRYLRLLGGAITERAPALELLAEARGAAGQVEPAAEAARELRSIAERAGTESLLGAARSAEAWALSAAGRADDARQAFEDAAGLLGRARLPFEECRARLALAGALRELGRGDAARRESERAHELLAGLRAVGQRRTRRLPAGRRPVGAGELSPREREVLRLVAQGKTNAEIAAALVLSEHTVHRHLANILAKLGASSRAAAVAAAGRHGLL